MFDRDMKDFGKYGIVTVGIIALFIVVAGVLNAAGLIGFTFVERKVFEQSYQRSESYKEKIATLEATLAELEARLAQPNLKPSTKAEIETQIVAVKAQLNAAKAQQ